jgi:hypothetical protein
MSSSPPISILDHELETGASPIAGAVIAENGLEVGHMGIAARDTYLHIISRITEVTAFPSREIGSK